MTTKGERTKAFIIKRSAKVFNQRGYWGTSIADLVEATGLERGGIYNHFSNKDEIAVAAFDYARNYIMQKLDQHTAEVSSANEKLKVLSGSFIKILDNAELPGGCAILNTAIVSDDTHPILKQQARNAMTSLREKIQVIIQNGIENGELMSDVNVDEFATTMISMLEGGIMMSKLYDDAQQLVTIINVLHRQIDAFTKQ